MSIVHKIRYVCAEVQQPLLPHHGGVPEEAGVCHHRGEALRLRRPGEAHRHGEAPRDNSAIVPVANIVSPVRRTSSVTVTLMPF